MEFLSRIVTVKASGMDVQTIRRCEVLRQKSVGTSLQLTTLTQLSRSFGALENQTAVVAIALPGSFMAMRGRIGIAELAACMR